MSGCKEDSAVRMNPGTGRLSGAGRDSASVSRRQIHQENLVEGVPGLPFALEHHPAPVSGEIAFSRPFAFKSDLANMAEQTIPGSIGGPFGDLGSSRA